MKCSVLVDSVGGCGQEVGKGLLTGSAGPGSISRWCRRHRGIYIHIHNVSLQAVGVLRISGLIHSPVKLVFISPVWPMN